MGMDSVSQDQRKRTLDALERRFAVAKAELLQQQKKTQKQRPIEEDSKENNNNITSSSSVASPANLAPAPITPFLNTSSKKDVEENSPAYSHLSHSVHDNLLTTNVKFQSKRGSMVDMILHELLQHGDSAQKYMQGSRSKKVDNCILLDNYVQGRGKSSSRIRALRAHSKRSKKHMSMKQHKKCGSFDLPEDLQKFDVFKPMHEMWKGYMMQLLKNNGRHHELAQCLLSADLHGAVIVVAECKIASFTGVSGIMIRETAETFGIITQDDKFRVVPKKYSVFIFQVDSWKITLLGDKLTSRNLGL